MVRSRRLTGWSWIAKFIQKEQQSVNENPWWLVTLALVGKERFWSVMSRTDFN